MNRTSGATAELFVENAGMSREQANEMLKKFIINRLPSEVRGGKVLPLKFYPSTALGMKCHATKEFDDDLARLIKSLGTTMYMTGGIGLAANQVGVLKRVFVCDIRSGESNGSEFRVFVNPVILDASEETEVAQEGCLSFPGVRENIERPKTVTVRAFASNGKPFETVISGLEARVFMHEFDHLEGSTWLEHMKPMARMMAIKKVKKIRRSITLDDRIAKKRQRVRTRRR